jgi:hypothetical protein
LSRDPAFAKDLATLQAVQPEKRYGTQTSSMLEVGQGTGKVTHEHLTFQYYTGAPGI